MKRYRFYLYVKLIFASVLEIIVIPSQGAQHRKYRSSLLSISVAGETHLFAKPLLSHGSCTLSYLAVVT
jgi:hypothetical protein